MPAPAALTAAQRLHLDVYGYVVVEQVLDPELTLQLREAIYEIEAAHRATGRFPEGVASYFTSTPDAFRIDNLPHVAPCFLDYVTHPRLVAMAEQATGGPVRLEQSDAAIRRPGGAAPDAFHRGGYLGFGFVAGGLYHYPFVKALTNLTDLGPDDGGTTVVAGSHKVDLPVEQVVAAARDDPRLVHQVVAPAGSTLLFFESLVHTGGVIRSGRDRVLVIAGYTPTMFQAWTGYDPDPDLVASLPEERRALLTGERRWAWAPRVPDLDPG